MAYEAEIPYGGYWSTPFARWQGAFSNLNSLQFAAQTLRQELANRKIPADAIDYGVLGFTVPQKHSFFGLPWVTGMAGLANVGGPTVMQACATGARALLAAAQEVEVGTCAGRGGDHLRSHLERAAHLLPQSERLRRHRHERGLGDG